LNTTQINPLFEIRERVIVITGAFGALSSAAVDYFIAQGARVACLGRGLETGRSSALEERCRRIDPQCEVLALAADVLDRVSLDKARDAIVQRWGRIDALLNAAGGNMPGATIPPENSFFDLDFSSFEQVVDLNLHGTVLPSLVFGEVMARQGKGSIVNFSSVSADRAITRVVAYSAAKAGVANFTRWLAVELARKTAGGVRVNAVMPGFFLGDQNRRLLTNEDGSLTNRGHRIIDHTPFGRFGLAEELTGTLHYLVSDASAFVTGITVPVDGGFTAFCGV
jgi:NAD(P)-dependent dehydrogenase (short-subunit alcohol dehydrogenase family)